MASSSLDIHEYDWADMMASARERTAATLEAERRAELGESGPQPMVEYQARPIDFFVEVLGDRREMFEWSLAGPAYDRHQWDGTVNPLLVAANALAQGQNTAIESATGIGKSAFVARAALWFLASYKPSRVATYAPRKDQLTDYMWAEMGKLWPRFRKAFPTAVFQDLALYMDGKRADRELWSAVGVPIQVKAGESISTRAAGIHGPHMMLVLEEVEGIAPSVIEALENTCTAPHNFFIAPGNPNSKTGALHQLAIRPGWQGITASALDHPNVVMGDANIVPGAVSRESIVNRAQKYGVPMIDGRFNYRAVEAHTAFKSRVRGIPPDQSKDALIRQEWVDAAILRQRTLMDREGGGTLSGLVAYLVKMRWPRALGIDPSQSEDGDYAGEVDMIGAYTPYAFAAPCRNATDLGSKVWLRARRENISPDNIGIDPIGLGAATVNEVRRQMSNASIHDTALPRIEGGGKPYRRIARIGEHIDGFEQDANLFGNLRAQMYWQAMLDLQGQRVGLPDDAELSQELVAVQYEVHAGKTWIEDKADIRKRTGRSPNKADAWVYANWVRSRTTPLDRTTRSPDTTDLGWKTVEADGKRKLAPMRPEDVDRAQHPRPGSATGGKWWK